MELISYRRNESRTSCKAFSPGTVSTAPVRTSSLRRFASAVHNSSIWPFLVTALSVGGVGLVNLIRGGFFKRLKERDARVRLLDLEHERRALAEESKPAKIDAAENATFLLEPRIVTETTTRELEPNQRARSDR